MKISQSRKRSLPTNNLLPMLTKPPIHGVMGSLEPNYISQVRPHLPGLQIHTVDHNRTANPCDWLSCCRAALPLVGCLHSLVYLHLPVVEGLIFCISAPPPSGNLLTIIPWSFCMTRAGLWSPAQQQTSQLSALSQHRSKSAEISWWCGEAVSSQQWQ